MLAFYAMNNFLPSGHPWVKHLTDAIADAHIDIYQDTGPLEVEKRVHSVLIALEGEHGPVLISGPSLGIWHVRKREHHKSDSSKKADDAISVQSSHNALLLHRSTINPQLSFRSLILLSNSGPHYNGFTLKAQRPSTSRGHT
jgi:hypothetical protein